MKGQVTAERGEFKLVQVHKRELLARERAHESSPRAYTHTHTHIGPKAAFNKAQLNASHRSFLHVLNV